MININTYIIEKLHINKDTKLDSNKDTINNEFIKALNYYLYNFYKINVGKYPDTLSASGKNNDYLVLNLSPGKRYLYKSIMAFINKSYPIRKECSTNNQHIYIYPKYE